MLVVFSSPATESITMFNDAAVELLKLMGATGRVPGGFGAADVPPALARLESAVEQIKRDTQAAPPVRPADNEDWASDEDKDVKRGPPVSLATRAVPLISLMRRAAGAQAPITWEARGR